MATCGTCGADHGAEARFCSACGAALHAEPDPERKIVTVLFADLAGSTALGARLDPEDVRELQQALYRLVAAEIERHGGVVEKFAGDAVLAVFGVPQAHEDDPVRAVRAALAAHAAFSGFAADVQARYGASVALRIGVNSGEVVASREAAARGELMVSGDVVNVAARLQTAARPGEVLVGERVRRASERAIVYGAERAESLRGKDGPVGCSPALEALARPLARGDGLTRAPLIGRGAEIAMLDLLAARARDERMPQLVTLFGAAGVGKTRLLEELTGRLGDATVLTGRCLSYGDGVTYWPLAEIAKAYAGVRENDEVEDARARLRAAVVDLVGGPDAAPAADAVAATVGLSEPERFPQMQGGDVTRTLAAAWARVIGALGRDRLCVLVIEDVHWASPALLDLLEATLDSLEDAALLVACSARPEFLDARPAWGGGRRNATAIDLRPLAQVDARQLVGALLDDLPVDDDALAQVAARAEGNPFFTEETVRMLVEQGTLRRRNGGWSLAEHEAAIPDSVLGVLAARIDLLEPDERRTLRACSVVGRTFWAEALDVDPQVLVSLTRRDLVAEQRTSSMQGMREYAFRHALTRDVAYAALPRSERRDLHLRVARWIEDVSPGRGSETAELIAHHRMQAAAFGAAGADELSETRAWLLRAGDGALRRAAPASARGHLQRALELAPQGSEHGHIKLLLGQVEQWVGTIDAALEHCECAHALFATAGDVRGQADALSWLSRCHWYRNQQPEALRAAEQAVEVLRGLPPGSELARALARRAQVEMLSGMPAANAHCAEALAAGEAAGDPLAIVNSLINLATSQAQTGGPVDLSLFDRALSEAVAAGLYEEGYRCVVNLVWSCAHELPLGELDERSRSALERLGGRIVGGVWEHYLELSLCRCVLIPAGRWSEADIVERSVAAAGDKTWASSTKMVYGEVATRLALARGRLEDAERTLARYLPLGDASGEPQRIVPLRAIAAHVAAVRGDAGATVEHVEAARLSLSSRDNPFWAIDLAFEAPRALARVGERGQVPVIAAAIRGDVTKSGVARSAAGLALLDGLTALAEGRPRDAIAPLERVREREVVREAPYEVARIDLDLARAHAESGDAAAAAAADERAQELLGPLGCVEAV